MAVYYFARHDFSSLGHAAQEYFSFITLVGSLYVVSGGIHIGVKGNATPLKNVLFLFIGAVLANILGTTGAAMLLIRPWIRMNQSRVSAHHIVFFIFLVANVGGCLTPIGDPPLFLGFLQGVPFWWIAQHCWPMWTVATGLLLAIFFVLDRTNFNRTPAAGRETPVVPGTWQMAGLGNVFFLAIILVAVLLSKPVFLREGLMLTAAFGSWFTTKKSVHAANDFNFHPVQEVAVLFAGIFATMTPALAWLDHNAGLLLGQNPSAGIFYFGTGVLSAVLDNAPTYLGFLSALSGITGGKSAAELVAEHPVPLLAISTGAVFFGAATYIGNGPNFMVKSIAEQNGVRMPSFGEFILKFSLPFLVPVLVLVWWMFFRG
jgi:Na+/H+ antiporter NhaD/arsenite permease-like protein